MISIKEALKAAGHTETIELVSSYGKYELIDPHGTSLGWKTWDEIVSNYNIVKALKENKTVALPYGCEKPHESNIKIQLVNVDCNSLKQVPEKVIKSLYGEESKDENVIGIEAVSPKPKKKLSKLKEGGLRHTVKGLKVSGSSIKKSNAVSNYVSKGNEVWLQYLSGKKQESLQTFSKNIKQIDKSKPKKDKWDIFCEQVTEDREGRRLLKKYIFELPEPKRDKTVQTFLLPNSDKLIKKEIKTNPERYRKIAPTAWLKRKFYACAYIAYPELASHKKAEVTDQPHYFEFDDEAYFIGINYPISITKLPFQICIIEDVEFSYKNQSIVIRPLSPDSNVEVAKHLLSYITHQAVISGNTYTTTKNQDKIPEMKENEKEEIKDNNISLIVLDSQIHKIFSNKSQNTKKREITHTFIRRGHWRNQACGKGRKQHKQIWIEECLISPSGKRYEGVDPSHIHKVRTTYKS